MPEDNQTVNPTETATEHRDPMLQTSLTSSTSDANTGNPPAPMDLAGRPVGTELRDDPSTEPIPSKSPAPAATASSYRDIIAERLARQGRPSSATRPSEGRSPMAHSSDVERTRVPEIPLSEAETLAKVPEGNIPEEIEAATRAQEIKPETSSQQDALSSSRERARLRQLERAELRRAGAQRPARPIVEEEHAIGESEMPEQLEETSVPEPMPKLVRAERREPIEQPREAREETREPREGRSRQDRGPRPERAAREDRGPREERSPREERTPREERAPREERVPREERTREPRGREERPQRTIEPRGIEPRTREERPERQRREEPVRQQRSIEPKPAIAELAGGEPKQTERTFESARALANKTGISVVIPLYNEQDSLRELTAALKQQLLRLAGARYEILYINDGSTDRSGEILEDILATSSRVTVLSFRRNLGKSAALAAGFAEAQYGIVITMDADLQDDPREFVNLIAKLAEGYDLISGWKKKRHDPMTKTGPSKFFNTITSLFSGIKLHDFNCGLKAYRKEVTDSLSVYGEMHRYLPALAYWQGFRVTEIPVVHHPRKFGKSKFGSSRFFKGFLDLITIVFTNRYGRRPLHLFGTVGTLLGFAGLVIDAWVTYDKFVGGIPLSNRPALLLGVLLILVGVQLVSLGLLGEMIVKNSFVRGGGSGYQKQKGRPSAEAQERRASRVARMGRIPGRSPRSGGNRERSREGSRDRQV
ncbi:MAG: glycosyltransferase [Bacteroidota bacterium]|nr:glycosyltransferase [Bacteroidota bacterium]MDP4232686.1 glycosyltransferase [Bacteroidota bacterium]MDP4243181.1 glycosyltransferase [Bacteroidota bacterium]MDP4287638.1 glycosyltransferase [Bacteroidota bacterium]